MRPWKDLPDAEKAEAEAVRLAVHRAMAPYHERYIRVLLAIWAATWWDGPESAKHHDRSDDARHRAAVAARYRLDLAYNEVVKATAHVRAQAALEAATALVRASKVSP